MFFLSNQRQLAVELTRHLSVGIRFVDRLIVRVLSSSPEPTLCCCYRTIGVGLNEFGLTCAMVICSVCYIILGICFRAVVIVILVFLRYAIMSYGAFAIGSIGVIVPHEWCLSLLIVPKPICHATGAHDLSGLAEHDRDNSARGHDSPLPPSQRQNSPLFTCHKTFPKCVFSPYTYDIKCHEEG